jgi:hypothetical protein
VGEDVKCHSMRTRACFPFFCVPNPNKIRKCTHWLPEASRGPPEFTSSRHRNSFRNLFHFRNIHAHTLYSLGLLRTLYTVKWIPPLGRRAGFGHTTNHWIAWNSEEGHSILRRFSEGHHSTPFIRGTEHIKSTPHKAAPQETSGWAQFLQTSESKWNNRYPTPLTQHWN